MGNWFRSPVLANITVSMLENEWRANAGTFSSIISARLFFACYVDNRLFFVQMSGSSPRMLFETFAVWFFTNPPVQLEDVADGEFLKFTIDPALLAVKFRLPADQNQFRPLKIAGTRAHKFAPAHSRMTAQPDIAMCVPNIPKLSKTPRR